MPFRREGLGEGRGDEGRNVGGTPLAVRDGEVTVNGEPGGRGDNGFGGGGSKRRSRGSWIEESTM